MVGTSWEEMQHHLLGPARRHRLATKAAASVEDRLLVQRDPVAREAAAYYRLRNRGPKDQRALNAHTPTLLRQRQTGATFFLRAKIQLLLLGECTAAEISDRLAIALPVVQMVEDLRFDLRGMRNGTDWILAKVILPTADQGHDDLAAQMRVAYFGGRRAAALALIEAKEGGFARCASRAVVLLVATAAC